MTLIDNVIRIPNSKFPVQYSLYNLHYIIMVAREIMRTFLAREVILHTAWLHTVFGKGIPVLGSSCHLQGELSFVSCLTKKQLVNQLVIIERRRSAVEATIITGKKTYY